MATLKSSQNVTVTIAAGATSGTATITSVNTGSSIVKKCGEYIGGSSTISQNIAGVQITSATQVTATRGASDVSLSLVVSVTVDEYYSSAIKSVNQGTIALNSVTSNTATITSVTTGNTPIFFGGWTVTSGSDTSWGTYAQVVLTNATTVTASVGQSFTGITAYYTALETNSGILNSSVQTGTITIASGTSTSGTATISSVGTSQTILPFQGWNYPNSIATSIYAIFPSLALTNATTITASMQYTTSKPSNISVPYGTMEFKSSDIKSFQSGTTIIGNGSTSQTSSITSVTQTLASLNWTGFNTSNASATFQTGNTDIEFTNPTTLTSKRQTSSTMTVTTAWQIPEFQQSNGNMFLVL